MMKFYQLGGAFLSGCFALAFALPVRAQTIANDIRMGDPEPLAIDLPLELEAASREVSPVVDGVMEGGAAWANLTSNPENKADAFRVLDGNRPRAAMPTTVVVTLDKENLNLFASLTHPSPANLRLTEKIWDGDDFEIFVRANTADAPVYQWLVSPENKVLGVRYQNHKAERIDLQKMPIRTGTRRERRGWSVEASIPLSLIGPPNERGGWKINFVRNNTAPTEVSSWSPVLAGKLGEPDRFGLVSLSANPVMVREARAHLAGIGENRVRLRLGARRGQWPLRLETQFDGEVPGRVLTPSIEFTNASSLTNEVEVAFQLDALPRGPVPLRMSVRDTQRTLLSFQTSVPAAVSPLGFDLRWRSAEVRIGTAVETMRDTTLRLRIQRDGRWGSRVAEQRIPLTSNVVKAELDFESLSPGGYQIVAEHVDKTGKVLATAKQYRFESGRFRPKLRLDGLPVAKQKPAAKQSFPLVMSPPPEESLQLTDWPVTVGVPFPRGALRDAGNIRVVDNAGQPVRAQVRKLGTWDHGESVRWALLSFPATRGRGYLVEYGRDVKASEVAGPLSVREEKDSIHVETGPVRFTVRKQGFRGIEEASLRAEGGWRPVIVPSGDNGAYLVDHTGKTYRPAADCRAEVVEAGPQRAWIRGEGWFTADDGAKLYRLRMNLYAHAGRAEVQADYTFLVTHRFEDFRIRDIGLNAKLAHSPAETTLRFGKGIETAPVKSWLVEPLDRTGAITVSGTDLAASSRVYLLQRAHLRYQVVRVANGQEHAVATGGRNGHYVDATGPLSGLGLAMRWTWQNYPKQWEYAQGTLTAHLWPKDVEEMDLRSGPFLKFFNRYDFVKDIVAKLGGKDDAGDIPPDLPEFEHKGEPADPRGLAKTHTIQYVFHAGTDAAATAEAAYVLQEPFYAFAQPAHVAATEVLGRFQPTDGGKYPAVSRWERRVVEQIEREWYTDDLGSPDGYRPVNVLGMFDFGDTLLEGRNRIHRVFVHHFYRNAGSLLWTAVRSADRNVRKVMEAKIQHQVDVDFSHNDWDAKAEHPLGHPTSSAVAAFWHWRYTTPGNTSDELVTTLMPYHYLTGDEPTRRLCVAWTDALLPDPNLQWDHRGYSAPLGALTSLYELTWDPKYLDCARKYIDVMLKNTIDRGEIGYTVINGPADFTMTYLYPVLEQYHSLTGDRAVAQYIVDQALWQARGAGGVWNPWDGFAYAWRLTREPFFAAAAVNGLAGAMAARAEVDAHQIYQGSRDIGFSFELLKTGSALACSEEQGFTPEWPRGRFMAMQGIRFTKLAKEPLFLDVQIGRPFGVTWAERQVSSGKLPRLIVEGPGQRMVFQRTCPGKLSPDNPYFYGWWIERISLEPDAPAGEYVVKLEDVAPADLDEYGYGLLVIDTNASTFRMLGEVRGLFSLRMTPVPLEFFVPAGTREFTLVHEYRTSNPPSSFEVRDGSGRVVTQERSTTRRGGRAGDPKFRVPIQVPAGADNQTWSVLIIEGEDFLHSVRLEGIPSEFSYRPVLPRLEVLTSGKAK